MPELRPSDIGCAIIWQAVADSMGRNIQSQSPGGKRRIQREAHDWFTRPSEDFDTVCAMVNIDPEALRKAYVSGILHHQWVEHPKISKATNKGRASA